MSRRGWCRKVNFREAKKEREGGCQREKEQEPVLGKRGRNSKTGLSRFPHDSFKSCGIFITL